jgi:hypothetical protein
MHAALFSRSLIRFATIIIMVFTSNISFGQSRYKPTELFPALPLLPPGNEYRTATGEPGPAYWQNQSDYVIDVTLDDKQNVIKGIATVTYTNNSPKALSSLWMQLDQNVYKKDSKGIQAGLFLYKNPAEKTTDGGFEIQGIKLADAQAGEIKYNIYDTRMELHLPEPLKTGQKLSFKIQYQYRFPENYKNADFQVNRTDILPTKNGNITLPSAYIVEGSGDLLNPEEVLTPVQLKRWQAAKESEEPVLIRSAKEVGDASSRQSIPTCTWKFRMDNTRDFAWTASKSFIWEALSFKLSSGKRVMGSSLYPIESAKKNSWLRSSEYLKFTLQYFSEKWHEYPFNKAVNVASNLDGMEYPGMVFCAAKDTGNMYWAVVNHELGHTWFPMTVGSNERKYAWMDEGFNLFIDMMATKAFNKGEFIGYAEIDSPRMALFADKLLPILSRPDAIPGNQVYTIQYQKVAYLLGLLRTQILGPERFDPAFRKYISDWAFKHPTPWDFFRSIDSSTGEDLTWFWKSMFLENFKLDQKIAKVEARDNKTLITIENMERAAMPLIVEITYKSGAKELRTFPVEIWEYSSSYTFAANKTEAIAKVTIDPEQVYPDVNKENNVYEVK